MPSVAQLVERLANNDDVIQLIESALVDEPPLSPSEGGVMRPGYSAELDQVKEASQNGQKWITGMEQRERKRTGISTLKVGYTKVFGYFIEVSNSQLSRVPADYVRKQFGLAVSRGPIFGLVARLVHQKGIDLVLSAADEIIDDRRAAIILLNVLNNVIACFFKTAVDNVDRRYSIEPISESNSISAVFGFDF